jgi:hypothetical protein
VKKNELLHLHALLWLLASESVEQGWATSEAFDTYRKLGVSPVGLRASRDDHQRAVRLLASTLAGCVHDDAPAAAPLDAN